MWSFSLYTVTITMHLWILVTKMNLQIVIKHNIYKKSLFWNQTILVYTVHLKISFYFMNLLMLRLLSLIILQTWLEKCSFSWWTASMFICIQESYGICHGTSIFVRVTVPVSITIIYCSQRDQSPNPTLYK